MKVKHAKKIAVVAGIIALVVVYKVFNLGDYFTLSYIKQQQAQFYVYYVDHRVPVVAAFMGIYIVVTALSLPGAAVMTIASGALFGLAVGSVAVSFASTIGATLACFVSRFLLRDWVQGKFGERLKAVNRGIDEEGTFYLFTLRLIPAIPFFVINLVIGLTRMRLRDFYWVSQIGMFPATVVYVNAGRELAKVESLSGVLSPSFIISFSLLGLFPITAKKLMALYKKRKHSTAD
jgi:uncharacterized membrane protein YdjX (TVP38/TMEM64 family)